MNINFTESAEPLATAIPNVFIDEYMGAENPVFVLVYITFYRYFSARLDVSLETVAKKLQLLESDVLKALNYWNTKGLISFSEQEDNIELAFLSLKSSDVKEEKEKDEEEDNVIRLPFIAETRPTYTIEELELYKGKSKEVRELFCMAENVLGKLLTYNDMNVLFSFHDWLRLPISVIEIMLTYCAENNHRSLRYIEKCALDWASNNIYTIEAANTYIKQFNTDYREILKAFGQSGRSPVASEVKLMKKWLNEYEMPLEIVLEACDRTVMKTGQGKFNYADKIIAGWFSNGLKTLDAIKVFDEAYNAEKEKAKEKEKEKPVRKSKKSNFSNFSQRDWDFEEIEKMEQKFLIDSIK